MGLATRMEVVEACGNQQEGQRIKVWCWEVDVFSFAGAIIEVLCR